MKNIKWILFIIMIVIGVTGCSSGGGNKGKTKTYTQNVEVGKYGENLPVSRAVAAKMISLSLYTKDQIEKKDKVIKFNDVAESDWFFSYVNSVFAEGYMQGEGECFLPLEPLSLSQAQILIDKIYKNNKTKIKITDETKDKPISLSLWSELFVNAIESEKGSIEELGIKEENLGVFVTPNNSDIAQWTMFTTKGEYDFSGFYMDGFVDTTIKVLTKNNEILGVLSIEDEKISLNNAYVSEYKDNTINIVSGKYNRWIGFDEDALGEVEKNFVTLEITSGQAKNMAVISEKISGTILKVGEESVEIKEYGIIEKHSDFKVYEEKNGITKEVSFRNLICGSDVGEFYIKDNIAYGAVIKKEAEAKDIRVLLSKSEFTGYVHENVEVSSSKGIIVENGDEVLEFLSLNINEDKFEFSGNRIFIYPKDEKSKLVVKTIEKSNKMIPEYRGFLEVEKTQDGFIIINQVGLEEYLYNVVPSEMPTKYGLEAAKVQAVTARSYAYNQFFANKFCEYGANVDDSVMSQVYNNIGESDVAIKAVDETKGECLTYNNTVISANFFSTSSGYTANSNEVWIDTQSGDFPVASLPYLTASKQFETQDYGDLKEDSNVREFLKNNEIDTFDSNSCWFRWSVKMSVEEISASINKNIKEAYNRNNMLIKTLDSDGTYKSMPIESIGVLEDIKVSKRGEGGNAMELVLKGSEKQVMIMTEYAIRTVLKPIQYIEGGEKIEILCSDGTKFYDYSLLPSGFFVLERMTLPNGALTEVRIYGGGNGHGVGMSQNGVYGMVQKNYGYTEILAHYYPQTKVNNIIS